MQVAKLMSEKNINFTKAKTIKDGIHIQPTSTEDHKKLTVLLEKIGVKYITRIYYQNKNLSRS